MAKKTEKEKSELTKAYEAMGEAMENWLKEIGNRVKAEVESIIYKKEEPESPAAPSETDEGFTDESKWGTCTPAFILENGLAESEERAVEVAQFLKDHPEKKDFEFLKELFIKTQFKLPADRRRNSYDVDFFQMAIIMKDDPIKVAQEEEASVQEPEAPAAVQEEAPDVAHPAAQTIPVQQQNPFGYNPMEQFLRGISMESQPMADQQPMVFTAPPQPQQTAPQRNIVNMNGILYEVTLDQQTGAPVLIPLASVEGIQQVNPTETQQVPPPHPAGFVVKEREKKEIVDTGMKVEGDLPGVDPSLIKEEPVKVKITPMVETEETPAENPLLSIVKGGHPEISEEAGNTLLWDVLGTIPDSPATSGN